MNAALRGSIEALAREPALQSFVPNVLLVAAETFGAASCSFFEVDENELIFLRYVYHQGRVITPLELPLLDEARYSTLKRLADGFTVPVEHLGVHPTRRTCTVVLDHRLAKRPSEFNTFAVGVGWELELNIPLLVGDTMRGAFLIHRSGDAAFSPSEILLAEALGRLLTFAMQASQIATREREAAIAREREKAVQQRADELGKANVALRAILSQLTSRPDHKAFLGAVLIEASRQLDADSGHLAIIDEEKGHVVTVAHSAGDQLLPMGEFPLSVPISESPSLPAIEAAGGPRNFDLKTERHLFMPGTIEWHRQFGSRTVLTVPMILGRKMVGFLGFAFRREVRLTPEKSELLMALAQQAALATELIRVSQKEKTAAIAREREQAAQERAEELSKANNALQATVDATSQVLELDQLVPVVLGIIGKVFETENCAIYENLPSGEVRLRYWHSEGRTLLPAGLLQLDEERYSLIRRLAAGFFVPPDYLGLDSRIPGTVILDHRKGTTVPEFDRWAISIGLELELNIGIGGRGVRSSTLCIYRKQGQPFTSGEVVLAESLAQQIGLAMQVTKLSQAGRQAAVAGEREQAARLKADELAKANSILTLRDRLMNLVAEASRELIRAPDLISGIHSLLRRMGESTGLSRVLFFLQREAANGEKEHYVVTEWCAPGIADHQSLGLDIIPNRIARPFLERMRNLSGFWLDIQETEEPLRSALAPLKVISTGCAPVFVDGEYAGVVTFDDCVDSRSDDSTHVDTFMALANFIGAALQRERSQASLLAEQRARAAAEARTASEREAAIFQERARLAGQIHDTLAQGFTGTLLHLEALRVRVMRGERVTVEELQGVRKIAALGLAEARRSALAIRPLALDGRDLSTALQQLTDRSGVPGLLDCRWSLAGLPRPLPPMADEALLNIAHEAVSNAIRHADASNILITLAFDPDGVSLLVRDDGIGFDASDSHRRGHTFGLRSMRERATAVGGELSVVSRHGEGTTVTVHLHSA